MNTIVSMFTVLFDDPFWVGIYERHCENKYEVCKIIFRTEPKDYEVYNFMIENFQTLQFSKSLQSSNPVEKHINPKRLQRKIKRQLETVSIGTKAQQALKLEHEQRKQEKKIRSRKRLLEDEQRKFELRIQKRKEKHRGH